MTENTKPVRAVLWDFGGVISSSPFEAFNRYESANGLPRDFIRSLNTANAHDNAWARLERSELAERARLINRARASAASPSTARARCAGSSSRAPARRSPPRNATRPRVTASRPGYTPTATAFTPPCWLSPWPTNSPASPGR